MHLTFADSAILTGLLLLIAHIGGLTYGLASLIWRGACQLRQLVRPLPARRHGG